MRIVRLDTPRKLGSWEETPWRRIDLPHTPSSLARLLGDAGIRSSSLSHQDIAHWCHAYWREAVLAKAAPREASPEAIALQTAEEIDNAWGGHLATSYSVRELRQLDFAQVRLPDDLWRKWKARVDAIVASRL